MLGSQGYSLGSDAWHSRAGPTERSVDGTRARRGRSDALDDWSTDAAYLLAQLSIAPDQRISAEYRVNSGVSVCDVVFREHEIDSVALLVAILILVIRKRFNAYHIGREFAEIEAF